MHDEKTVQRFIELRVQGRVFTRIAAELNVTKPPSSPGAIRLLVTAWFNTQNLTGKNIPPHGQATVKFSRSALTCLLRIGWGDLSRLGNGERSSAEPKARSGPNERARVSQRGRRPDEVYRRFNGGIWNLTGKNKVCFGQATVKFCGGSHPGCQLIPNSDVEVGSGATARGARAKNRCQKGPNRAKKRHEITPDTPKPFEPMIAIPPASSFQVLTAASQNLDSGHLRSSLVTFGNLRTPYRLGGVPIMDLKGRTGLGQPLSLPPCEDLTGPEFGFN
jgi:hypothetical protein